MTTEGIKSTGNRYACSARFLTILCREKYADTSARRPGATALRKRMGRRLIDISAALRAGIMSDPPANLPEIDYQDHHQTAPGMADYMGIQVDQLPNGEYC